MKRKLLLLGALFCWLAINAPFLFAGVPSVDKIVKGTVKDGSTNETLIGSTVTLKGTTKGVITDVNGNYSISVPEDNAVLVFAFIGYDPQEIRVGTQSEINVSLASNSSELAEVVVIGYGNTRSKDVTGSVKSI